MFKSLSFEYDESIIQMFAKEKLKQEKTRRDYIREVIEFMEFTNKEYQNCNIDDCQRYINSLTERTHLPEGNKNRLSKATVEKKYSILFSFFNYLEYYFRSNDKLNFVNPFKNINKPSATRNISQNKIITWSELDRLVSILKNYKARDYIALLLIFTSGLTLSETTKLKWNQFIEDRNGNIGIKFPLKNGQSRYVKVTKDVWELLSKYRNEKPYGKDSYVFLNKFNRPISGRWLREVLTRACKEAKLENKYTPRDLRHTAAARALQNGASAHIVKEQFGWSDYRLADRYNYSIPILEDNAIDYINFKLK